MMRRLAIAVGLVAFTVATHGEVMAQSKCTALKLLATGKNAAAKGGCYAKLAGLPVACAPKGAAADLKMAAFFAKGEGAADCLGPIGDAAARALDSDAFVAGVWGLVSVAAPAMTPCDARKVKAAAKAAAAKLKCHARLAGKGIAALPGLAPCLAAADGRFGATIAKAELAGVGPGLCTFVGQAVPLGVAVDPGFVGTVGMVGTVVGDLCPVGPC